MPKIHGGARWLSSRASDSGARGWGFETYFRRVVTFSRALHSPKVLVIPRNRGLRPDMTVKLLTGTLSLNTNKQNIYIHGCRAFSIKLLYTCTRQPFFVSISYIHGCRTSKIKLLFTWQPFPMPKGMAAVQSA